MLSGVGERCDPGPGLTMGGPLVGAGTAVTGMATVTGTAAETKWSRGCDSLEVAVSWGEQIREHRTYIKIRYWLGAKN